MDAFSVLGIPANSSKDKIKSAYRRLARSCHPDVRSDKEQAEREFKELQQAYELALQTVTTSGRRRPQRPPPPPKPEPTKPPPPLESFRVQAAGRWEMEDFGAVVRSCAINPSYGKFGGEIILEFGSMLALKVTIPKGMENGQRLRIVRGYWVFIIRFVFEDHPTKFGPLDE